ncbi:MAG: uroporphyrinogen decarboxylase family protein [Spirochaetota bacterium]
MNSHERFAAAMEHRAADRVPIDYLAHRTADAKLRAHFGVRTESELLDILGADFYYLSCRDISQNETCLPFYKKPLAMNETERTCPLGIRWHRGAYDAKFTVDEAVAGPLANAETEADILSHAWPTPKDFDFSPFIRECNENNDRVIIGGLWTGIMGDSYRTMGFEKFLLYAAMNPGMIKTLINKLTDVYLSINDAIFSQLKGRMHIWFFGNDFGSQNGLLLSKDMWCDFFFENIKRLTSLAHSYGLSVMMHSCGAIAEIIPLLIDAGVDILDPIQVTAKGMDAAALKRDFGGRMVFHGGIDTQEILPRGSVDDVRGHVMSTVKILGALGGYIFAPSQILQTDVPVGNIEAMYRAALLSR